MNVAILRVLFFVMGVLCLVTGAFAFYAGVSATLGDRVACAFYVVWGALAVWLAVHPPSGRFAAVLRRASARLYWGVPLAVVPLSILVGCHLAGHALGSPAFAILALAAVAGGAILFYDMP